MPRSAPAPFLGGHDRAPRRPGFGAGELAKCVIIMIEEVLSVRDMAAHLHARPDPPERTGRGGITSKSTPARARRRLATPCLRPPIFLMAKSAPARPARAARTAAACAACCAGPQKPAARLF